MPRRRTADLTIRGRAPGKILLFGEHAVVYGEVALGLPLSRGVEVVLGPGRGRLRLSLGPGLQATPSREAASPRVLAEKVFGAELAALDLQVRLEIPPMAGFGTSAAYAIALLRAQDAWRQQQGRRPLTADLLRRALQVEALAHGRPSGVDPATCLAAGLIRFQRRGRSIQVTPLAPTSTSYWVVGHQGAHGGARRSISRLAAWKDAEPRLVGSVVSALGQAAEAGERALLRGELARVGEAMNLAHGILSGLELVSPGVKARVEELRAAGALGAKMSGAGGAGGAFVALFGEARAAERAAQALGGWVEILGPAQELAGHLG